MNRSKVYNFKEYKGLKKNNIKFAVYKNDKEQQDVISNMFGETNILVNSDVLYRKELSVDSEGSDIMSEKNSNDILLKYMGSIDKKYDDFKRDMIESEKRISNDRRDTEQRIEKRMSEIQQQNLYLERKIDSLLDKIDNKFDRIDEKIDNLKDNFSNEIQENNKYAKNLVITTIIGIAAMVIAVVSVAVAVFLSR